MANSRKQQLVLTILLVLLISVNGTSPPYVAPPQIVTYLPTVNGTFFPIFAGPEPLTQDIKVIIDGNSLVVDGCNRNTATFRYNDTASTYELGPFLSTKRGCINNQDKLIMDALANSKTIAGAGDQIFFKNSQNTITLKLSKTKDVTYPGLDLSQMLGKYSVFDTRQVEITAQISVQITENQIRFNGCNSNWASLKFNAKTKALEIGDFASTLISCQIDQDFFVASAFKKSIYAVFVNGNLVFKDALNQDTVIIQRTKPAPQGVDISQIVGNYYVLQTNERNINVDINVNITQTEVRFFGCNTNWASLKYNAYTRSFKIGDFASTLVSCSNDQDRYVAKAFSRSVYAIFRDGALVFKDASNQDTVIIQKSKVVLGLQLSEIVGNYYVLQTNEINISADINVNITETEVRFFGCNTNWATLKYNAFARSFEISSFASTRVGCLVDQDRYVANAFSRSVYAIFRDGALVFKDASNQDTVIIQKTRINGSSLGLSQILGNYFVFDTRNVEITAEISVQISDNTIRFYGCNNNWASLKYDARTKSYTVGDFASTLVSCTKDQDSVVSDAFKASVRAFSRDGFLIFKDSFDRETIILSIENTHKASIIDVTPVDPNIVTPVIIPTDPIDPAITYVPTVIKKDVYYMSPVEGSFPATVVSITDDYITLEGACNYIVLPYAAYNDGLFTILPDISSTNRNCPYNNDKVYLDLLKASNRFVIVKDGIELYKAGKLLLRLTRKYRNDVVRLSVLDGGYSVTVQNWIARVTGSKINFIGDCNEFTANYQIKDGSIFFTKLKYTARTCAYNYDRIFVDSINKANGIRRVDDGYILVDDSGKEIMRFISVTTSSGYYYNAFSGKYIVQLPNVGIRLSLDNGKLTLAGCNQLTSSFWVNDQGIITFSKSSTTTITCDTDHDNLYASTIINANSIAVAGSNIIFFNAAGDQVAKALNFDPVKQDKGFYDPRYPIVPLEDFIFPRGSYKLAISRSSYKTINATIDGNDINFKICNSYTVGYKATNYGKIKLIAGGSTKVGCPNPTEDRIYTNILIQAVSFHYTKGIITLYDANDMQIITITSDFKDTSSLTDLVIVDPPRPVLPPIILNSTNVFDKIDFSILDDILKSNGRFELELISKLFQVTPESDIVVKTGCEIVRAGVKKDGNKWRVGKFNDNKKQCQGYSPINFFKDILLQTSSVFIKKETKTTTTSSSNFQFVLVSSDGSEISINSEQSKSNTETKTEILNSTISSVTLPVGGLDLLSGLYSASIPKINISFDKDGIQLDGCNGKLDYTATRDGDFKINKSACNIGKVNPYIRALQASSGISVVGDSVVFRNDLGDDIARCSRRR